MSLEAAPETRDAPPAGETPFVSVLMPVRNETGYIGACLAALGAQDYARDHFEVILVDGESDDGTLVEIEFSRREYGVPDIVLTNPRRTTATGLNLALSQAKGDVIVRVDGHTRIEPNFLSASVRALLESGADAVGGPIRTLGEGEVGSAIALAMSSSFGIGDAAFRHADTDAPVWTDTVAFAAYLRAVFTDARFDETIAYGEDDEFNYRLRNRGGRILLVPGIGVAYYARSSLSGLARQYWRYGLAKAAVLQRHPGRLRARHLVPSAFVLTLAGGALLSVIDRRFGGLAALAAGAYAVTNLGATLRIARRERGAAVRYLPFAFATIHLSAGAGMLAGFARLLLGRGKASR